MCESQPNVERLMSSSKSEIVSSAMHPIASTTCRLRPINKFLRDQQVFTADMTALP